MNIYHVTIFGIKLTLKPVAFTVNIGAFSWDIYWYGIIIACGFLCAILYAYKNAKRFNINSDKMLDVILVTTPLAILCARAYYCIFDDDGFTGLSEFFGIGTHSGFAGLAIYGGVIGAFGVGALMCYIKKIKILDMFDLTAIGFLIGQGIGRWGNFINQEAFGCLTGSSFFGMQSENTVAVVGKGMVHPCFLYESIWCISGFLILNRLSANRKFSGETVLMYCTWYGFGRAFIELLRTDSLMIGNLKVSFLLSSVICIASAAALLALRKRFAAVAAENTEISEESENV